MAPAFVPRHSSRCQLLHIRFAQNSRRSLSSCTLDSAGYRLGDQGRLGVSSCVALIAPAFKRLVVVRRLSWSMAGAQVDALEIERGLV